MIPSARPEISAAALDYLREVIQTGHITMGPMVERFEREFASLLNARHAVAVSSATTGLHLLLLANGIGAGDEVIVPAFTFVATGNAVLHAGAVPVFADVKRSDWNMDPADLERRVTTRTRAIIAVHQYGMPADMAAYAGIAEKHGLLLIEDSACVLGTKIGAKHISDGSFPAVFSFHPRKIITTGEGGMIVTNDDRLAGSIRKMRYHGFRTEPPTVEGCPPQEVYDAVGYNYKLTDLQAAVGLEQLPRLEEFVEKRRAIGAAYDAAFRDCGHYCFYTAPHDVFFNCQSYLLVTKSEFARNTLLAHLAGSGIGARRAAPALHLQPVFARYCKEITLPMAEEVASRGILLPIFTSMTRAEQEKVIQSVLDGEKG